MATYILGISCFYHDSAACLLKDGEIVAAAHEERFTRKKHDASFPKHAVSFCLGEGGITIDDLDYVSFYEKPIVKFDRILQTSVAYAPRGIVPFMLAMPLWLKDRIWMKGALRKELYEYTGPIIFPTHHESHAASAFYPSPFDRAAVITFDAVGEWNTTTYGVGDGNRLTIQKSIDFPHSIGMLYSAFTYYCGFRVNSGEYKLMGLAPYGEPKYKGKILKHLIDIKDDGSFALDMSYFAYGHKMVMTNGRFDKLFGGKPRDPEEGIEERHMDLAASIQVVTEELMLKVAKHVQKETGERNLVMAGGVALNCVGNGRLLREGVFDHIWVQPAAGDAGGALGSALYVWYEYLQNSRLHSAPQGDAMSGCFLGPSFSNTDIETVLQRVGASYEKVVPEDLPARTAKLIAEGNVIGWFQGRMEYGPRALGARSILGDARDPEMQRRMNLKIKFRESFRPFAPSVLEEYAGEYFDGAKKHPYMLFTFNVTKDYRKEVETLKEGFSALTQTRSDIPAVTHVDYSARVQTVSKDTHPRYHALIEAFYNLTGCPVIINTSFNVRGEPIVCTPEDARNCFVHTHIDYLVIGDYIVRKEEVPDTASMEKWAETFEKD